VKVKRDSARILATRGGKYLFFTPLGSRAMRPVRPIARLRDSFPFTSNLSAVHCQCIVLRCGLRDSVRHVEAVDSDSGRKKPTTGALWTYKSQFREDRDSLFEIRGRAIPS
jgi:hypothetical protein